jgi:UDP-N-acetylglucosamine 2-epimerase (non-hydrolysing)
MTRMVWGVVGAARHFQVEVRKKGSTVMSASRDLVFAVGSCEEFLRVAPIVLELQQGQGPFIPKIVYQGCPEDLTKDGSLVRVLRLPPFDEFLGVRAGTPGYVTARACEAFEHYFLSHQAPIAGVMVCGDGECSLAGALAATKLGIPIAHLDAGLRRSDGLRVGEEINRLVIDHVADLLFVSEPHSLHRLKKEGIRPDRIRYVGNVMCDALKSLAPLLERFDVLTKHRLMLPGSEIILVNLAHTEFAYSSGLLDLMDLLKIVSPRIPVVMLVNRETYFACSSRHVPAAVQGAGQVVFLKDWGYLDYLALLSRARVILSDRETAQEESAFFNIPCVLLSNQTTRPSAVTRGTTFLSGENWVGVRYLVELILNGGGKRVDAIEGWDGHAASRILNILADRWTFKAAVVPEVPVCVS